MNGDAAQHARAAYLDLLERAILDSIYGESAFDMKMRSLVQRLRHPYLTRRGTFDWPSRAHSMIGQKRIRNIRGLVERTLNENVPGDYIETGVWRGGACIMMRGVLQAYNVRDRQVLCADSFEGCRSRTPKKYPADRRDRLFAFKQLAVSMESVRQNFASYGLLDEQVAFLKGFFKDTLPALGSRRFALIRLDGDMYESTMDALTNLYDRLSNSGFVIIDDYGGLRNCRQAVHDFLDQRNLRPEIAAIDDSGVWWQKT